MSPSKLRWLTTAFVFAVLICAVVVIPQPSQEVPKEQDQHEVRSTDFFAKENIIFQRNKILESEMFFKDEAIKTVEDRPRRALTQIAVPSVSPAPTPAPKPTVKEMICEAFGRYCKKAIRVAMCESGARPKAYNPDDPYGGSYGIFQINGVHLTDRGVAHNYKPKDLFKPAINIKIALKLSNGGKSWGPWACRDA